MFLSTFCKTHFKLTVSGVCFVRRLFIHFDNIVCSPYTFAPNRIRQELHRHKCAGEIISVDWIQTGGNSDSNLQHNRHRLRSTAHVFIIIIIIISLKRWNVMSCSSVDNTIKLATLTFLLVILYWRRGECD